MDMEKVIEGLERVYEYIKSSNLHPSGSEKAMAMNSVKYAITLLKEQEAVKPLFKTNPVTGTEQYLCGNCQRRFLFELDRYCPHCGKQVKWE